MTVVRGRIGYLAGWTEIAAALLVGSAALAEPQLLLVNAKVFTADPALPYAQAVEVEGGRILAVGSNEQVRWVDRARGSSTRVAGWSPLA
jgi:hypothetical protein